MPLLGQVHGGGGADAAAAARDDGQGSGLMADRASMHALLPGDAETARPDGAVTGLGGSAGAAVDEVLVPAGFLPAVGGEDGERGQVLWCCAYDDLARDRPGSTGGEQERGVGACVDLMVDARLQAGQWRVTAVRVEVQPLTGSCGGPATRPAPYGRGPGRSGARAGPAELADLLSGLLR